MTRMKKLASILLALVMVMAVATASAATVDNQTSHAYKAYQVFSGTQAENGVALGDVVWGNGVNGEKLLSTLKADYNYFDNCNSAADVAAVLAGLNDDCAEAKALANAAAECLTATCVEIAADAKSVELAAGYYLLVDATTPSEGDAMNSALLQVTNKGDIKIEKKYTAPSVDKDIIENDTEVEATDKEIGDSVTFQITGTLPSNYADYDTYKYVFHDTLSTGLTYNGDVKVYVVNTVENAEGDKEVVTTDVTASFTTTANGTALDVSCANLKTITTATIDSNSKIVVQYTATLNENADIGQPGNNNTVYLEYSNNPNWDGTGDKEPTGNTPKDEVIVFTYELDVTKEDGNTSAKLADAQFVLLNADKTKVAKINNGKLVGWDADADITKNADGTYPAAYTVSSNASGLFSISGLDDGVYYLKETKAPAGYNLLKEPIKLEIKATVNTDEANPALTDIKIAVGEGDSVSETNGSIASGKVATTVKNNSGATLPETGGIGTTILYVAGGLLIAAALVVLLAKRRTAA